MKWLKKLFSKLFGCKCGCQEAKPCTCNIDLSKIDEDKIVVDGKNIKITTKKEAKKAEAKTEKKKPAKKTNKKAKK